MKKVACSFNCLFLLGYLYLVVVIFVLPFFTLEGYSILRNTTSELGAQQTPYAYVMNTAFFLTGILSVLSGWRLLDRFWFQKILLMLFGFALAMTGVFRHAPIDQSIFYSIPQDQWHSVFASITGLSFTLFAFSYGFITKKKSDRILAFFVAISATLLSILMAEINEYRGLWQRMIFVFCLGWMVYVFHSEKQLSGTSKSH